MGRASHWALSQPKLGAGEGVGDVLLSAPGSDVLTNPVIEGKGLEVDPCGRVDAEHAGAGAAWRLPTPSSSSECIRLPSGQGP